ncbi:MAG: class I SAM-dependent methyltransferase [Elusimicrobia bacterium]|nr:class I SAM-dependent methyltransferase [Elusimicrobiota bacterium]
MDEVFGDAYAAAYDTFYREKDYASECDVLERVFRTYGQAPVRSVLDLGCGTGSHSIPLARRGLEVSGVDLSEGMLAQARKKASGLPAGRTAAFHRGDLRSFDLGRRFDAALMMFNVLGYQLEDEDVLSALKSARRHLEPGGLLVFDVWHGPAVVGTKPSQRSKTFPAPGGRLERTASGRLDEERRVCTVDILVRRWEGERLASETRESHPMRYFFPEDLERFLGAAGFTRLRTGAFPGIDQEPDAATWNVLVVGRAA